MKITSGCLLPGSEKSEGTVIRSKSKMDELRTNFNTVGTENIRLNIYNLIGDNEN